MNLIEADKIVAQAHPNEYRSVRFEVTTDGDNRKTRCEIYVNKRGLYAGHTWGEAIAKMNGTYRPPVADMSEAVGAEDGE